MKILNKNYKNIISEDEIFTYEDEDYVDDVVYIRQEEAYMPILEAARNGNKREFLQICKTARLDAGANTCSRLIDEVAVGDTSSVRWLVAFGSELDVDGFNYLSMSDTEFIKELSRRVRSALRERARKRALKSAAVIAGCARPDLLQYAKGFDPIPLALFIDSKAESMGIENPYDSCGVYGFDLSLMAKIWFSAGCVLSQKTRTVVGYVLAVLKKYGRIDTMPYNIVPPKSVSNANAWCYLKGVERAKFVGCKLSAKAYVRLGKVSNLMAKALLVGVGRDNSRLNYALGHKVQSMSKVEQARLLLSEVGSWFYLFGRLPKGYSEVPGIKNVPVYFKEHAAARKAFMNIMKRALPLYGEENAYQIAVRLSAMFNDIGAVDRWVSGNGGDLHDAAQFSLPKVEKINRARWAVFMGKFPETQWMTDVFYTFEKKFGRLPNSIAEFRTVAQSLEYSNLTLDTELNVLFAEVRMGTDLASKYVKFFEAKASANSTMVPNVVISKGDYTFRRLGDNDRRGPMLGLYTDCCQHLGNVGKPCAIAGWVNPDSAFYVVEKAGKVIAQSWAWVDGVDTLVFDSIEAKGGVDVETVANFYKRAAEKLVATNPFGIKKVNVGNTGYGITKKVKTFLGVDSKCEPARMMTKVSYTDAKAQWRLAGE
jgi:hypothetical protein